MRKQESTDCQAVTRVCTKMLQYFSRKRQFTLENRNGILWDSVLSTVAKQAQSPCGAQRVFPTGCNVMMRRPRAEKHPSSLHLPIQEARKELGHLHFMFWVKLTYHVQIGCNSKAKEKNRKKILRTKTHPLPSAIFFIYIYSDQNILENYSRLPFPPLKFNFLFIVHKKNTVIVQWQDINSLKK